MDFFNKSNLCFSVSASSFSETVLESLSSSTSQKASLASSKRTGKELQAERHGIPWNDCIAFTNTLQLQAAREKKNGSSRWQFHPPNFFWRSTLGHSLWASCFQTLPSTKKIFRKQHYIFMCIYSIYIHSCLKIIFVVAQFCPWALNHRRKPRNLKVSKWFWKDWIMIVYKPKD